MVCATSRIPDAPRSATVWITDVATWDPTEEPPIREDAPPSLWRLIEWMHNRRLLWFVGSPADRGRLPWIFYSFFRVRSFRADRHIHDFAQALRRRVRRSGADELCANLSILADGPIQYWDENTCFGNGIPRTFTGTRFASTLRHVIWHPEDFSGVRAVANAAALSVETLQRRMRDAALIPMEDFRRVLLTMHATTLMADGYPIGEVVEELLYVPADGSRAHGIRALRRQTRAKTGLTPYEIHSLGATPYAYRLTEALRRLAPSHADVRHAYDKSTPQRKLGWRESYDSEQKRGAIMNDALTRAFKLWAALDDSAEAERILEAEEQS